MTCWCIIVCVCHDPYTHLQATWNMLDKDGDGSVTAAELQERLSKLEGLSVTEVEEMVRVADTDGNGEVDYQEFVVAFHSSSWMKARLMGKAAMQFDGFKAIVHAPACEFTPCSRIFQKRVSMSCFDGDTTRRHSRTNIIARRRTKSATSQAMEPCLRSL